MNARDIIKLAAQLYVYDAVNLSHFKNYEIILSGRGSLNLYGESIYSK